MMASMAEQRRFIHMLENVSNERLWIVYDNLCKLKANKALTLSDENLLKKISDEMERRTNPVESK